MADRLVQSKHPYLDWLVASRVLRQAQRASGRGPPTVQDDSLRSSSCFAQDDRELWPRFAPKERARTWGTKKSRPLRVTQWRCERGKHFAVTAL